MGLWETRPLASLAQNAATACSNKHAQEKTTFSNFDKFCYKTLSFVELAVGHFNFLSALGTL
jgi:hypothetical protein